MENQDMLKWTGTATSSAIDEAICKQIQATAIVRRFLMPYLGVGKDDETVPADTISFRNSAHGASSLTVNSTTSLPILEVRVPIALGVTHVNRIGTNPYLEGGFARAANLLAQAEDLLFFQGQEALNHRIFQDKKAHLSHDSAHRMNDFGLLSHRESYVNVPINAQGRYGQNTAVAVGTALALLQDQGHYGPYALVLPTRAYGDFIVPLHDTAIIPAEMMKWVVTTKDTCDKPVIHFYGTGVLPADTGVLVSIGSDVIDIVISVDATARATHQDSEGWNFVLYERLALRLKDMTAVVQLKFEQKTK